MSDEMINKTKPTPKKGVDGIGDTIGTHYQEYDMNIMNDPIHAPVGKNERYYTKGQSK